MPTLPYKYIIIHSDTCISIREPLLALHNGVLLIEVRLYILINFDI